ncbi:RNA polymerase sigma-32 factor [Desulfobaculum xiamenense]|uniref:RNA polymerase sigma factor n=1 Tax=Desulfobaculum xiamenense TaxID=995050 RepID=A0A846QIN5_9BACT|nr:RNA polymerase factor sigma-32 [Desulfobaculum xiamenense]NJB66940.1 RNA polymerase sigma-32 factor [Desulfobaculum xiamenense]
MEDHTIIDENDIEFESEDDAIEGESEDIVEGEWEHPADDDDDDSHEKALTLVGSSDIMPRDPLRLYLREISRFPLLAPEEELELARRVRDEGDNEAAFRIVSSHLRLVVKIAMEFQRRWMQNVLDLIQEGNVGLMRAVQKFDPEKGIKFSYYAAFWIKAYILKFIMDNWRLVKIGTTQSQRKLFYNLNKERQRLQNLGFDPDTATLSKNLGVAEDVIIEMDQRLARQDMSLNVPLGEDGGASRMDFLPALEQGIEDNVAQDEISAMVRKHIQAILPQLSDKERDILASRLLTDEPATLREIGEKYDITRERVRQIEARLLEKLRKHMAEHISDFSDDWIHTDE